MTTAWPPSPPAGFLPDATTGGKVYHRGGVDWYYARPPRRWHRCRVQTWAYGVGDRDEVVERCACGAINLQQRGEERYWMNRNTR